MPAPKPEVKPAPKAVPIKWDPADGPCPHCAALAEAKVPGREKNDMRRACDGCEKLIPVYVAMQGAGYQSHSHHHFHLIELGPRACWEPVHAELCRECYLKDFAAVYPTLPAPKCMAVVNG